MSAPAAAPGPPRIARRVARLLVRGRHAEFILADLDEAYADVRRARGGVAASLRYARLVLGSMRAARRVRGASSSGRVGAGIGNDVRFAARMLRKNPGFTAVTVLTLALGIGTNTAIFSVLNGVLLRPLPYEAPHELVNVWQVFRDWQRSDVASFRRMAESFPISWPAYREWSRRTRALESLAVYTEGFDIVESGDGADWIATVETTATLEAVLGVQPQLGRWIAADEDRLGGDLVVVLSHGFWQRRYGGDPSIIGQTLRIVGRGPHTVIGVMPRQFYFPARDVELWVAITDDRRNDRFNSQSMAAVARLGDGVSMSTAQLEMDRIAEQIRDDFPDAIDAGVRLLSRVDEVAGDAGATLMLLMGAVALVLVVASANVAALLLVRATARRHEFAVRAALGARGGRLIVQTLLEGILLAVLGGAVALTSVFASLGGLRRALPPATPRLADITIDWRVVAFTIAISAIVAVAFGFAAAFHALGRSAAAALREQGQRLVGRHRGRSTLVVGEVAVSVVLLTAAVLMTRSYLRLDALDRGFVAEGVLTARVLAPESSWQSEEALRQFFDATLERLGALPEVVNVGAVSRVPFSGRSSSGGFGLAADPQSEAETGWSLEQRVTPGYFEAMGIRLLQGRLFDAQDGPDVPRVMIVNESFAARYFPDRSPIGEVVWESADPAVPYQIVGLVADLKHRRLDEEVERKRYRAFAQDVGMDMVVVLRADGDVVASGAAVTEAVRSIDRLATTTEIAALEGLVARATAWPRFRTLMLVTLSTIAMLLSAIGVYGIVSFAVADRAAEIGLRMTLGAQRGDVLRQVVGSGLRLILPGVAVGSVAAVAASRLIESYLYEIAAVDPVSFVAVVTLVTILATLATWLPAWRASRVDPLVALRRA